MTAVLRAGYTDSCYTLHSLATVEVYTFERLSFLYIAETPPMKERQGLI